MKFQQNEKIHKMVKVLVRGHRPCSTVGDDGGPVRISGDAGTSGLSFGSLAITTTDAKGKKRKEQLQNAALFTCDQMNEKCRGCMRSLGECVLEQISSLDKSHKKFEESRKKEKEKHYEYFCHAQFKYMAV